MLDGINLVAALVLCFSAAAMVASAYALIWAIKPIIDLLSHEYMENQYTWTKEDEAGFQDYIKKQNW